MAHTITFSVHRNPQKDTDGNDTYQVRHENWHTVRKQEFLEHLRRHHTMSPELMDMALSVLENEIVELLADNKRLHLEGLGTFYLKLGFRTGTDDEGNEQKPRFTNPKDITGKDVCISTIGFTPDRQFLGKMAAHGYSFENKTGRGQVGHSAHYDDPQFLQRLGQYLDQHGSITRRQMMREFGITSYMATKWLDRLTSAPAPLLRAEKIGTSLLYRRRSPE